MKEAKKPRLIDADALDKNIKEIYCKGCNSYNGVRCRACWVDDASIAIDSAPTIEAEPVVRCKDCKHYSRNPSRNINLGFRFCKKFDNITRETDYCSFGERKEENAPD